jgi:hypothetical protein
VPNGNSSALRHRIGGRCQKRHLSDTVRRHFRCHIRYSSVPNMLLPCLPSGAPDPVSRNLPRCVTQHVAENKESRWFCVGTVQTERDAVHTVTCRGSSPHCDIQGKTCLPPVGCLRARCRENGRGYRALGVNTFLVQPWV